jgi:hypothetical protein
VPSGKVTLLTLNNGRALSLTAGQHIDEDWTLPLHKPMTGQ